MSLKEARNKFVKSAKKILKKDLTTNEQTLRGYEVEIVQEYNRAISFVLKYYQHPRISQIKKEKLLAFATCVTEKFFLCLQNLKKSYVFPETGLHLVDPKGIIPLEGYSASILCNAL